MFAFIYILYKTLSSSLDALLKTTSSQKLLPLHHTVPRLISWSILFVFLDLKALVPLAVNLAVNYTVSVVHGTRDNAATHFVWMSASLGKTKKILRPLP